MRILLTADPELPVPPLLYGGIERVIDLLIKGLRERGHEVGLVAHPLSSVVVRQLFPWPGKHSQNRADVVRNTAALYQAAQEFAPDIIHSFSRVWYLLPLLRQSVPKIMSYQRPPGARAVSWGARLGRGSLTFTGCSQHICQAGSQAGGVWHAIHNCVETSQYTFQPQVAADAPLVFLSRIERIKGAHTAIAVARKTGRRLLIAGNYTETGDEGRYWREQIKPQLGRDGVEYVGAVNDAQKNELLGQAAAMIVPIEWDEPFGIVFAEALACGTPVISAPRGALPEIVSPGVDGFLETDLAALCRAVNQIAGLDRHNCRSKAEAKFSSAAIVGKYEQLYATLVAEARPAKGLKSRFKGGMNHS